MASRKLPPSNPISEIPDLDIALPSRQLAARRNEVSVRPTAAQSPSYGLEGILDDDLLGSDFDSSALDIEVSDAARHTGAGSLPGSVQAWPHGTTPESGSVEIAPNQLEALCSWGERPSHWWETIIYAFLVYQGRRQLKSQMGPVERELNQAEVRRDECLAQLAMARKDSLEREGSFNSALEAVEAALSEQRQLAERQQRTEAELSSEARALDEALAKTDTEINELDKQASNLRSQLEDAEIALKREQARVQRLGIEQRNIEQTSPPGSPALARLGELAAQVQALEPQIELAQAAVDSARAALDEATEAMQDKTSHASELKRRKDLQGQSLTTRLRQVSVAADGAMDRQRRVLADLGRSILATRGRIAVDDVILREVARHDEAVATIWRRHQVYALALENFDTAGARQGTRLAIAFLAVIVIAMAWRLFG